MAIRYDKKLNQEINRTIKNFNQKISRLEKQERDLILPEKITKKALKESVYTRSELRRKLKELQRYSTRNIEETLTTKSGIKTSKYELINLKKETARIKRNLTNEIKKLENEKPKIFGKTQARTFAEMGDQHYLNLIARRKLLNKNIEKLSQKEFERFKNLVDKTIKNKVYMNNVFKENYLKMLTDLGYYYDYDKDKLKFLKDKIMKLASNNFQKLFESDKAIRAILDYYPIITDTSTSIDPVDIKHDVTNLYDSLIDNLDEIVDFYA